MQEEVFKFHPRYNVELSNLGNVRNRVNQFATKFRTTKGTRFRRAGFKETFEYYCKVAPFDGSKKVQRRVHQLVLEAFGQERTQDKCVVDHIDRNSENNQLVNLRWVSYKENNNNRKKRE